MKLNITYRRGGESGEWSSEESEAVSRWNRAALALLVVFVLAALIAASGESLSFEAGNARGFVGWFLFCCAYPLLGLCGLANTLLGTADSSLMEAMHRHPVAGLLILNVLTYGAIWLAGRLAGPRWLGAAKLRIAANFLLILVCWGLFQLLLFGTATIWERGGFRVPASAPAAAERN